VRIFLAEKGISVPLETIDILKRDNRQPAFLAKNPFGGIPVLELDDGGCIAESVAICRYFEALQPNPPLFGATPREQAEVEMWNRRVELGLGTAIGQVWVHGHPITAQLFEQIPANVEPNRKRAAQVFELLDAALAKRAFLAGDRFSVADISLLCITDFAGTMLQLAPGPKLANFARWHREVSARPSASA
jgi:glutathione S-transferase